MTFALTVGQQFTSSVTGDTITIVKVGPKEATYSTGAYKYRWPLGEIQRAVESGHWKEVVT
jgi:hypothetical protein